MACEPRGGGGGGGRADAEARASWAWVRPQAGPEGQKTEAGWWSSNQAREEWVWGATVGLGAMEHPGVGQDRCVLRPGSRSWAAGIEDWRCAGGAGEEEERRGRLGALRRPPGPGGFWRWEQIREGQGCWGNVRSPRSGWGCPLAARPHSAWTQAWPCCAYSLVSPKQICVFSF